MTPLTPTIGRNSPRPSLGAIRTTQNNLRQCIPGPPVATKQHVIEVRLASLPVDVAMRFNAMKSGDLFQVRKAELFGLSLRLGPTRFLCCGHSGQSFRRKYAFLRDD